MASSTIIVLPEMPGNILAYIGALFTDLSGLVILCIGLPIAFWVIIKIIALVRSGFKTEK